MGYELLWLESLIAALLFIAMVFAVSARFKSRLLAALVNVPAVMLVLAIGFQGVALSLFLRMRWSLKNDWMPYTVSWFVILVVGIFVLRRAQRKATLETGTAAGWPRGRLAIACCAAFALTCTTYWNIETTLRLKNDAEKQEAIARIMSLIPPSVPDKRNAALLYKKAFLDLHKLRSENALSPTNPTTMSEKVERDWNAKINSPELNVANPELIAHLEKHQGVIALLKKAAAMPDCAFDLDFQARSGTVVSSQLPDLITVRACAHLLATDARWKAANGRVREAFENIAAINNIAAHMGAYPELITGLVACGVHSIAVDAQEGILRTVKPTASDLAPVMGENPVSFERVFYRSMKGEEEFGISAIVDLPNYMTPTGNLSSEGRTQRWILPQALWHLALSTDDVEIYKKYFLQLEKDFGLNAALRNRPVQITFKERLAKAKELDDEFKKNPQGVLPQMMLPAMSHFVKQFAQCEAQQRLSQLALAIAAYQAKYGKLPETPKALVPDFIPEIPTDPFDEKPLRFKKTAKGIVLYSLGQDLVDDGGAEHEKKRDGAKEPTTILFHIGE